MHRLFLALGMLALLLIIGPVCLVAQVGQTLHIVRGNKVTLRADASHALSFIWFKNGVPIHGQHDQRIVVTEAALYNVIALGDNCNSDLSDTLEIIVDPLASEKMLDIEIRNLPEKTTVWKDQEFNHQLIVLNKGQTTADSLIVQFEIPEQLAYVSATAQPGTSIVMDPLKRILLWKINSLPAKAVITQWIRLRGQQTGPALTIAQVSSKQQDSIPQNNKAEALLQIVSISIPNVFTPNGDGKNDTFVIGGSALFKNVALRVFNSTGYEVYRADKYANDWDGRGLHEGTYFYFLTIQDARGQMHSSKGYVTILNSRPE